MEIAKKLGWHFCRPPVRVSGISSQNAKNITHSQRARPPMIAGQWRVTEHFSPRNIAGRWKGGDHSADLKVFLVKTPAAKPPAAVSV